MEHTLTAQLLDYLERHERLVWVGQPQKGLVI